MSNQKNDLKGLEESFDRALKVIEDCDEAYEILEENDLFDEADELRKTMSELKQTILKRKRELES